MNTMDDLKPVAENFIRQLAAGEFAAAMARFDGNMLQALPEAKLKEAWGQILTQVGPYQQILGSQAGERQGQPIVTVSGQFDRAAMNFVVSFNEGGQIAGLNVTLGAATTAYQSPAYVNSAAFHETEVTVGSGPWALPGTLSLPAGAGPFPAVMLVHGSGPQDRDETIGPNRPFRDLAWGLASQGIAVLRYEKRTKEHAALYTPELVAAITVQEETIDDALAAVRLLRQTPGIDPRCLYVLGHSLGATLAPRIGQQDPSIAGLIILAGIARTLEDTILDQFTYLYSLSGSPTKDQQAELDELKLKVARAKEPNLSAMPAKDLPLCIQPAYWLSLRGYQPHEVARALDMRLLVLQGGRDYQVTPEGDFALWQKALAGQGNVTFKLYPKLFHLFIPGEGPSTPQEYFVEGHVSDEVINDIAHWIRQ